MTAMEIHYSEGWAALYVDGKLHGEPGDSYLAEEQAFALLGVKQIQDDAWLRGGNGHGEPAPARTTDEIDEYRRARQARLDKAQAKRDQAARLIAEANALDPTGRTG
jgi:hypothetical protein